MEAEVTVQMALEHTFISMLIVFCVLITISFIIYLLKFVPALLEPKKNSRILDNKIQNNDNSKPVNVQNVVADNQAGYANELQSEDLQIVAVISAAIATLMSEETGNVVDPGSFVIRSIKKRK